MVEIVDSSLFSVEKGIICQQTNCIGLADGNIILQMKERWPKAYSAYLTKCKLFNSKPELLLGHVQDVLVSEDLVVANCFGRVGAGSCLIDNEAWDVMLDKLKDLRSYFSLQLHFPYGIGYGLTGSNWSILEQKIYKAFSQDKETVFIHKLGKS